MDIRDIFELWDLRVDYDGLPEEKKKEIDMLKLAKNPIFMGIASTIALMVAILIEEWPIVVVVLLIGVWFGFEFYKIRAKSQEMKADILTMVSMKALEATEVDEMEKDLKQDNEFNIMFFQILTASKFGLILITAISILILVFGSAFLSNAFIGFIVFPPWLYLSVTVFADAAETVKKDLETSLKGHLEKAYNYDPQRIQ